MFAEALCALFSAAHCKDCQELLGKTNESFCCDGFNKKLKDLVFLLLGTKDGKKDLSLESDTRSLTCRVKAKKGQTDVENNNQYEI